MNVLLFYELKTLGGGGEWWGVGLIVEHVVCRYFNENWKLQREISFYSYLPYIWLDMVYDIHGGLCVPQFTICLSCF